MGSPQLRDSTRKGRDRFWTRPPLPRGFRKRAETLAVLNAVLSGALEKEEAMDRLGGREKVNLADIDWYVNRLKREAPVKPDRLVLGQGGRVVIPAQYREALGVDEGDELRIRFEDGELRLTTPDQALRRAQAMLRRHIPATRSLADELISERRQEAKRE